MGSRRMLTERLQKVPTLPPALPTTGRCADDSRARPSSSPVGDWARRACRGCRSHAMAKPAVPLLPRIPSAPPHDILQKRVATLRGSRSKIKIKKRKGSKGKTLTLLLEVKSASDTHGRTGQTAGRGDVGTARARDPGVQPARLPEGHLTP